MSTECSTLTVRVAAPSRLHFGLLSVGPASQPQFGGVGAMIDQPGLELIIRPSDQFQVVGQHAERVRRVANHVLESYPLEAGLRCCIEVTRAADHHVGLGTGTQLALSVTAGLLRYVGASDLTAVQLASLAGALALVNRYSRFFTRWIAVRGTEERRTGVGAADIARRTS